MANATKRQVKMEMISLTVTYAEAKTLAEVMYRVGGCPYKSRRRDTNMITTALNNVGVYATGDHPVDNGEDVASDVSGHITFDDLED